MKSSALMKRIPKPSVKNHKRQRKQDQKRPEKGIQQAQEKNRQITRSLPSL